MSSRTSWWLVSMVCLFFLPSSVGGQAKSDPLSYRDRGDRWEGVRWEPSSASAELWSVLVEGPAAPDEIPGRPTLHFHLPPESDPSLVVREVRNRFYYWLDRVESEWRPGEWNEFSWPADEVLLRIRHQEAPRPFRLTDLGALVRLDRETPSIDEHVAPAAWGEIGPGTPIEAYVFTFLGAHWPAGYRCVVRAEGDEEPILTRTLARTRPSEPFSCRWRPKTAPGGRYRLTLEDREEKTVQTVRFAHVVPGEGGGAGADG